MIELVLATNNESKIKEYRSILKPYGIEIKTLKDVGVESDPIENGKSYEENAMIKARAVWDILHVPVIADDSGLEIDALDGEPGLRTKRFAPSEKATDCICKKLSGRGLGIIARSATLVCALCYINAEGTTHIIKKKVSGYLDTSGYLAGDHAKFDGCWPYELFTVHIDSPIRTLSDYDVSFRNAVSHRGLAGAYMAKYILSENNAEEHHKMTHEEILDAIDEASNILKNASNEILQVERIINKIKVENGGTKNDR